MWRRAFLGSVPVGAMTVAGCLDRTAGTDETGSTTDEESAADAPDFDVDEDVSGEWMLLRIQPQAQNGIAVSDEFDVGVVLGNAGGEPVSEDVTVDLVPPTDDEAVQTASIPVDDELPSGAARFFRAGPFEATVAGEWEVTGGSGIEAVHPAFDGTIAVSDRES